MTNQVNNFGHFFYLTDTSNDAHYKNIFNFSKNIAYLLNYE